MHGSHRAGDIKIFFCFLGGLTHGSGKDHISVDRKSMQLETDQIGGFMG